jgi:hypothetical protein
VNIDIVDPSAHQPCALDQQQHFRIAGRADRLRRLPQTGSPITPGWISTSPSRRSVARGGGARAQALTEKFKQSKRKNTAAIWRSEVLPTLLKCKL